MHCVSLFLGPITFTFPAAMAAANPTAVTINVGGEKIIQVKPDLFSVAGENQFASMFSERWQSDSDKEIPVFVDYSPQVFLPLIEFLRLLRDSKPNLAVPVVVDPAYRPAWIRLVLVAAFHPKVLRKAGVTLQEMHDSGCDAACMREAGFTAEELLSIPASTAFAQCPLQQKVQELVEAGYSPQELRQAGLAPKQLKQAGMTPQQLLDGGLTIEELQQASFTPRELAQGGLTIQQLPEVGFRAEQRREAGFTPQRLSEGELEIVDV
eukprot:s23_g43.t1